MSNIVESGLVRLITPLGEQGDIVSKNYAEQFCSKHDDWDWRYLTEQELTNHI